MAQILRPKRVIERSGLTKSPLYAAVAAGVFTRPVKIGGARASGWPAHEIDALIQARIAGASDDDIRKLVQRLHEARKTAHQPIAA